MAAMVTRIDCRNIRAERALHRKSGCYDSHAAIHLPRRCGYFAPNETRPDNQNVWPTLKFSTYLERLLESAQIVDPGKTATRHAQLPRGTAGREEQLVVTEATP